MEIYFCLASPTIWCSASEHPGGSPDQWRQTVFLMRNSPDDIWRQNREVWAPPNLQPCLTSSYLSQRIPHTELLPPGIHTLLNLSALVLISSKNILTSNAQNQKKGLLKNQVYYIKTYSITLSFSLTVKSRTASVV